MMSDSIILVGLMGSGKSTVGRQLAKCFERPFYDSDQEIVRRTGASIPMIFEMEGEVGFRLREEMVIADLVQLPAIVLATGGGVVLSAKNRAQLATHGIVVYLRGNPDELWQRTRNDKNRPLLQVGDPRARLAQLYAERDVLYREVADVIVDTGRQSVHALVQDLAQHLSFLLRRLRDSG